MNQSPCREPMAYGRPSAFDSGGGDTGTSTTVQNAEPWSGIQPFLTGANGQPGLYPLAAQQVQTPQQYFPGSTVVGFSPETEAALGYTTERALAGSPLLGAAQAEAQRTLQGDYLAEGNPYLDAVGDRLYRQIRPRVDAQFARGPAGSPGHGFSMANALGDAMAPYHFGAYESERGRMQSAMGAAPGLANADYFDAAQLAGAGQQRESLQSRILQDQINRFNFGQQEPMQRLAQYAGLLGTGVGPNNITSTQTSQQPGSNPMLGILGAGLSAAPYLAMAFSDRRIKTDIEKVGMLDNGLPVYSYRYKAGGPPHIGLMAQDVEKVNPDAVKEFGGIKAVDYLAAVGDMP